MTGLVFAGLRLLAVVALYGFLGWALYTLWNDLRQQGHVLARRKVPPIVLTTEAPPVKEYRFTRPEISIGRAPGSDLQLHNEAVSTLHTRLTYRQNQWWLEDMHSTNGTFLNGQRLTAPVVLTTGDLVGLGEINLLVSVEKE